MEDILASIRRILSEDEQAPPPAHEPPPEDDVLDLDHAMMVHAPAHPSAPLPEVKEPMSEHETQTHPAEIHPPADLPVDHHDEHLVAPATAHAAASSVSQLVRTLGTDRGTGISRGTGPTIEDVVREEVRPILKEWLDTHLPPLVERLVRTEIERVVSRASY